MGIGKKITKSLKKHFGSWSAFRRTSNQYNPGQELFNRRGPTRKLLRGLRSGTWRANVGKYMYGVNRHAISDYLQPVNSAQSYQYNGKTIRELING